MARIFLSHSSSDNAAAVALRDWLMAEGWDDLFLDLDPERGISAGERWERALNEAAYRCEAVLFLTSTAWLKSTWCMREFRLAGRLNKRMFGVLIEDLPDTALPAELISTWQIVNLATGPGQMFRATMLDGKEEHVVFATAGLARLKTGLSKAGLDSRFFAWPPNDDPDRPPYRGLRPLEAEDAGIFFGREAPIIETLDRLRGLRDSAPPRFLAILGASGAGKSSFLRAGLIPRLIRDDRNFLVLPIIRPERAAISGEMGLLHSLETAAKAAALKPKRAELKKTVADGAQAVGALLAALSEKAAPPALQDEPDSKPPTIILAIDQGEELFQSEGSEEAQSLLALVRDLATAPSPDLIVLFTIRSDSYERLQTAGALDGLRQQTMSLPPLPKGAYQTVIEGPANRLRDTTRALKIEPRLTEALLAGIEAGGAKDALPLLAFTLERLYLEHGGDGDLKLSDYEEIGGIAGSIEASVERALKAADNDPAVPRERTARLALMRRAFIPWLAGIDPETGSPRRAIARLTEIPEESRPLVQHLINQHLLATDLSAKGERTIEPAHEALLRQWGLLQGWLKEDFAQLSALEGVKRATRDWLANDRSADWLAHAAGRLEDAETLNTRPDLAGKLDPADRDYLSACRASETARKEEDLEEARQLAEAQRKIAEEQHHLAEEQRRNAEAARKAAMRLRIVAVVAVILAVLSIATAIYGYIKAREAQEKTAIALEKSAEAETERQTAEQEKRKALYNEGVALSGLSRAALAEGLSAKAMKLALAAWPRDSDPRRPMLHRTIASLAAALPLHNERSLLRGHAKGITSAAFSPDGALVVTTSHDKTARLWNAKTGATIFTLRGHGDSILSAAFSPDGLRILTASQDKTARLWDVRSGAEIMVLKGHDGYVRSGVFSPDGTSLITASFDKTARLWDAQTGAQIAVLKGHANTVNSAFFSLDGGRAVTASSDGTARLWNAKTGAEIAVLKGHENTLNSAVFSADGTRVVTASYDKTARLWDARTGAEIAILKGHENSVWSAVFSPDGTRIVTASSDKTARLWNARTGAQIAVLKGHLEPLKSAVFSPNSQRVVTASADKAARLWDAKTGAEMIVLKGHENAVRSASFSPDGMRVLTASDDWTARLWDVNTGTWLRALRGHQGTVNSAAFSPDGMQLVTASDDETARLWNATTGALITVLKDHDANVRTAVFSADGTRVLTASYDNTARLWDTKTGAAIAVFKGHSGPVSAAVFSPDEARIATASFDKTARLWDAKTGKQIAVLKGHVSIVNSAAFSPDGNWVVTASADKTVRLWRGAQVVVLSAHQGAANSARFSPDGTRLVTTSEDRTARLWDVKTGAPIAILKGHQGPVTSAAFSPDGSRVMTTSSDNTARLWNANSGSEVTVLKGHEGYVTSAALSPDGTRIATASSDSTVRIWDANTGAEIALLRGHANWVTSALFSPDGTRLVTASGDGSARIWDISRLEKGDAFAIACERLGNDTDLADVRARYGLGELNPICGDHPPLPVDPPKLQ